MKNIKIKIGSVIKSYDFYGNTECYLIGEVTEINGTVLVCKTLKQVFNNLEEAPTNDVFQTVIQGEGLMDDKYIRVELVK